MTQIFIDEHFEPAPGRGPTQTHPASQSRARTEVVDVGTFASKPCFLCPRSSQTKMGNTSIHQPFHQIHPFYYLKAFQICVDFAFFFSAIAGPRGIPPGMYRVKFGSVLYTFRSNLIIDPACKSFITFQRYLYTSAGRYPGQFVGPRLGSGRA